jgi:hypothetical protein
MCSQWLVPFIHFDRSHRGHGPVAQRDQAVGTDLLHRVLSAAVLYDFLLDVLVVREVGALEVDVGLGVEALVLVGQAEDVSCEC